MENKTELHNLARTLYRSLSEEQQIKACNLLLLMQDTEEVKTHFLGFESDEK